MKSLSILFLLSLQCSVYLAGQCYNQVWSDEFDGTAVDNSKWSFQTGAGGWGNNELQYYTDRIDNATVSGGTLKIIAKNESYMGATYTSARMRSINQGDWTYGKMEASIKLPQGQGIWPAFWMMPTNSAYGTWPRSGEIDIMEYLGHQTATIYGTCHYGNTYLDKGQTSGSNNVSPGTYADGAFHTFAVEWEPTQIRWYVDGFHYLTYYAGDEVPYIFPFDKDFHFILNMAVGGNWPGNPDGTTVFPQTLEVDYVRTYQLLSDIAIQGDEMVETNATGIVFSVPEIAGTTYNWTLPANATITNGGGTHQITVNWGNSGGNVEVSLNNTCGMEVLVLPVSVSANQSPNPGFEEDFSNWFSDVFDTASANWTINTADVHSGNKAMCVAVSNIGTASWNIQLSPLSVELVSGEEYTIQFWAKADANNKTISVAVINTSTFAYYSGSSFSTTDTWALYSHTFTASATATSDINIQFAHELGTYCIDDFLFARTVLLPIEVRYFRGQASKVSNELNWETSTELDGSHFELERSNDGIHFERIATILAENTPNGASYQFVDYSASNKSYYRLKLVDIDHAFAYSKIILLQKELIASVQVSPIPAKDRIQLSSVEKDAIISIYSASGQSLDVQYSPNDEGVSVDISALPNGVYFIKIEDRQSDNKEGASFQFIKSD